MPAFRCVSTAVWLVLALACAALVLAWSAPVAGAATTGSDDCEALGEWSHSRVVDLPAADLPTDRPAFVGAAGRSYGYDAASNLPSTVARSGDYQSAPNTTPDQPCAGMLVYRVYGPDSGAGEFGASWSPIDPRTIGPADYRDLAGLPDSNPGTHLVIGELIDPSAVAEVREALECDDPHCAEYRPGGLLEFLIPSNPATVVNRTYQPLYPPY